MPPIRLLQANLNHSRGAHDLLIAKSREWSIDVAMVAKSYRELPQGLTRTCGGATIAWIGVAASPLRFLGRGVGYVAARWGNHTVVAVYFLPSMDASAVTRSLDEIGVLVGGLRPARAIVAGDFNAKARAWGSPAANQRGHLVLGWAAETGLVIINDIQRPVDTCVRQNGGSIVDITFATPLAARDIRGWRVLEKETLSDHRYIRYDMAPLRDLSPPRRPRRGTLPPQWALKKVDKEAVAEASIVQAWVEPTRPVGADEKAVQFREAMHNVCDASMPRTGRQSPGGRRAVYWWTPEVAKLWEASNGARRRLARHRRLRCRDQDHQRIEAELYDLCKTARKDLQQVIAGRRPRLGTPSWRL